MTPRHVLGFNCAYDASAALLTDGEIVCAIAQERISRVKHEPYAVSGAISYVLAAARLSMTDIDLVVTCLHGLSDLLADDQERAFLNILAASAGRFLIVESHHELHALSAHLSSPFDHSLILVSDGLGTKVAQATKLLTECPYENHVTGLDLLGDGYHESLTFYHARDLAIRPILRRFSTHLTGKWAREDVSLGRLYSYASKRLFSTRFDAGKVMALAPLGPQPEMLKYVLLREGGAVEVIGDRLADFDVEGPLLSYEDRTKLASQVQYDLEQSILHRVRDGLKRTGSTRLTLSGGVALNCVANSKILAETLAADVFCNSAPSDDGIALGACFFGWLRLGGDQAPLSRTFFPYLGASYSAEEIQRALAKLTGAHVVEMESELAVADAVAREIAAGRVFAWWQGRSEFGPRALGNRSILAAPFAHETAAFINDKIKTREALNPFAGSFLPQEFVRLTGSTETFLDRYMLRVVRIGTRFAHSLAAICHVDGTTRSQVVREEWNPIFSRLIHSFQSITGYGVVLNTSLNGSGEPIVETPEEAVALFARLPVDGLGIGRWLVNRV